MNKDIIEHLLELFKKELINEFDNGNLKQTFNHNLVNNERYADTFIGTIRQKVKTALEEKNERRF